ncbi:MAG: hypothetical protein ACK4ND_14915 [Cytophagaceae bacterium]
MEKLHLISDDSHDDSILRIQKEISILEQEFEKKKTELAGFERQIHAKLHFQISRMHELQALYKKHKAVKKAKRLEQKKRGKNYIEPKRVPMATESVLNKSTLSLEEQKELKRLYKDAIVRIHPDKVEQTGEPEKIQNANQLTAKLNGLYKSGDLDELINFYQYVLCENSSNNAYETSRPEVNQEVRMEYLKKKKTALEKQLEQLTGSYTYHVLTTYENPLSFIDELHDYFQERITLFEKRTRKVLK